MTKMQNKAAKPKGVVKSNKEEALKTGAKSVAKVGSSGPALRNVDLMH
jgi:hypothetical protein